MFVTAWNKFQIHNYTCFFVLMNVYVVQFVCMNVCVQKFVFGQFSLYLFVRKLLLEIESTGTTTNFG